MRRLIWLLLLISPLTLAQSPRGMDFEVFIRLERGMTEGEVLTRAGEPDLLSVDGAQEFSASSAVVTPPVINRGKFSQTNVIKTYTYLPTIANPFTTVITFSGGRLVNIERIKKF
ncbi:MAG: DUF2845 domain-containing protein [Burkholderiales bacterium]